MPAIASFELVETAEEPEVLPLLEETPKLDPFPLDVGPRVARVRLGSRSRRGRSGPCLPAEPAVFPWLARRFAPGEVTVWSGSRPALEPTLELLYVGSALAGGRISLVEGGNRFHPYRIGELGRALGGDATETLRRIRLARAFTAYQLIALVGGWAREVRRHPSDLLVGHDLPALFEDPEIPLEERGALLRHLARTLATLVRRVAAPVLLTLGPRGPAEFPGLAEEGPPWCDHVTFGRGHGGIHARSLRSDARLTWVARPAGQHGMEEYAETPSEEVIAWVVPPRRTARRSKSG